MKISRILAISLCAFTLGTAGTAYADRETIIGGAIGAAAGALIGEQVYGRDGMMMGGIVGGALGAAAGKNYEDDRRDDDRRDTWRRDRERDWRYRDGYNNASRYNNGRYGNSTRYSNNGRYINNRSAQPRFIRGEGPRRNF